MSSKLLKSFTRGTLGVALMGLFFCPMAFAQPTITVTVDENGHGFVEGLIDVLDADGNSIPLPFALVDDPGPGGLANALTYFLPFPTFPGDLIINEEPSDPSGGLSDVIRFPGDGRLIFYSDLVPGDVDLADIGFPTDFLPPIAVVNEVGKPEHNGVIYTPVVGDPGSFPDPEVTITYNIISDAPEPATIALMPLGLAALGLARSRRQRMKIEA